MALEHGVSEVKFRECLEKREVITWDKVVDGLRRITTENQPLGLASEK